MTTVSIPLTRGQTALIDEEDLPLVAPYKWRAVCMSGLWYAHAWNTTVKPSVRISMHRLITGNPVGLEVDHKNGDGLDNRRSNLRPTTHSLNKANTGRYRTNRTGYKGVQPSGYARNPWRAQMRRNGKSHHIGHFATAEEAARAYDVAAKEFFGEFARTNF